MCFVRERESSVSSPRSLFVFFARDLSKVCLVLSRSICALISCSVHSYNQIASCLRETTTFHDMKTSVHVNSKHIAGGEKGTFFELVMRNLHSAFCLKGKGRAELSGLGAKSCRRKTDVSIKTNLFAFCARTRLRRTRRRDGMRTK